MSDEGTAKNPYDRYLGDGVYASYDGYQIYLAVGDYEHKVVALDSSVMLELLRYTIDIGVIDIVMQGNGGSGK